MVKAFCFSKLFLRKITFLLRWEHVGEMLTTSRGQAMDRIDAQQYMKHEHYGIRSQNRAIAASARYSAQAGRESKLGTCPHHVDNTLLTHLERQDARQFERSSPYVDGDIPPASSSGFTRSPSVQAQPRSESVGSRGSRGSRRRTPASQRIQYVVSLFASEC
jgi:hypothetical protein